jgi:hypothetical protein
VLTEGFQSAFVACVVLAGIAVLPALTLLGAPRKAPHKRGHRFNGWNTLLLVTRGRRSAAALVTGQEITLDGGLA